MTKSEKVGTRDLRLGVELQHDTQVFGQVLLERRLLKGGKDMSDEG